MSDDNKISLPTTVHGIAALAGCVLMLLAFVDYDRDRGRITPRPSPCYAMVAGGAGLLAVALAAYAMSHKSTKSSTAEKRSESVSPQVTVNVAQHVASKMPHLQKEDGIHNQEEISRKANHTESETSVGMTKTQPPIDLRYTAGIDRDRVDAIAAAVASLSGTQKDLMVFFYGLHRPQLQLDEAYDFLEKADSGRVASKDELYFRLKDLKSKDLIGLATQARSISFVRLRPDVAATLEALRLLPSGD